MSGASQDSQTGSLQELYALPERDRLESAFEMCASCQELLDAAQLIVEHSEALQEEAVELLQQKLPAASCRMTWLKACFAPPGAPPTPLRLLSGATPYMRQTLRVAGRQPAAWQRHAAVELNILFFRTRFLQLPPDLSQIITARVGRPLRRVSHSFLEAAGPLQCGLRAATTDSLLLLHDHLTQSPLGPPSQAAHPSLNPPTSSQRLVGVTALELHAPEWHKNGSWYLSRRVAAILPALPRLASLLLSGADTMEVSEEHLAPLRALAPTLTRLHISCRAFQSPSTAVARHLRPLTALRAVTLWGCHWDGAAGKTEVVDALASLPDLLYLDVDISHAVPRGANELALQQLWLPRLAALSGLTHITVYPWLLPQQEDGAPAAFSLPRDAWPAVQSLALDLRWRWRRAGYNYGAVRLDAGAVEELGRWLAARAGTLVALRLDADMRGVGGSDDDGSTGSAGATAAAAAAVPSAESMPAAADDGASAMASAEHTTEVPTTSAAAAAASDPIAVATATATAAVTLTSATMTAAPDSHTDPSPSSVPIPHPPSVPPTTRPATPATPRASTMSPAPDSPPPTPPPNPGLAAMATLRLHDLQLSCRIEASTPLLAALTAGSALRRLRLAGGAAYAPALPIRSIAATLQVLDVEVTLRELQGVLAAAARLPRLRALRLQQGVDLGADGRTSSAPWPPQGALGHLGRLTQLRALQLAAAWRLPLGVLRTVGRLGGLRHLGLEAHVQAVLPDEEGMDVQPLRALGHLTGLVLKNCLDGVRSRELASVLCSLPALEVLQMQQQPVMLPMLPRAVRSLRLWGVGSLADIKSLRAAAGRQGCLLEFGRCELPDMLSDEVDAVVNS